MTLDALTIAAILRDLERSLPQARIERLTQPMRSDLAFSLRRGASQFMLYFSSELPCPWLGMVDALPASPASPPAFCMLLRKHLMGGRLVRLRQSPFERVVDMVIEHYDELAGLGQRTLHLELAGRRGNAVLVDADGTILDALWRHSADGKRPLEPGAPYQPLAASQRLNPDALAEGTFHNLLAYAPSDLPVAGLFQQHLLGLSTAVIAGLLTEAGLEATRRVGDLVASERDRLWASLAAMIGRVRAGDLAVQIVRDADGRFAGVLPFPCPVPPGCRQEPVQSPAAVGRLFADAAADERLRRYRAGLAAKADAAVKRAHRKLAKQSVESAAADNAQSHREYGELILAHLAEVPRGAAEVALPSLSDPARAVLVPLDPALTASANAQKHFRRYQRAKRGQKAIAEQMAKTQEELAYLAQLTFSLEAAETAGELAEIAAEMAGEGYSPRTRAPVTARPGPRRHLSGEGLEILIGRNNRQNEQLTFDLAGPNDIWLHTRNIPGAHVIVRRGKAAAVPPATLLDAANLAVYHSQARQGTKVPVDYTERKHVRKRPGGRTGLVTYDRFRTIVVDPSPAILARLLGNWLLTPACRRDNKG